MDDPPGNSIFLPDIAGIMDNSTKTAQKIPEGFIGQKMIVLPPDRAMIMAGNALSKSLFTTAIGYYPHASHHDRERKKGSEQYILLYCVEGTGWIITAAGEIRLGPHTFFILPRNTPHHYGSSQKEPWSIYWVHFSGDHAALLYSRYRAHANDAALSTPYDEARIDLFNRLIAGLENDLNDEAAELSHIQLMQFISSFIYPPYATPDENDSIGRSVAFMKLQLANNVKVTELAAAANYSVSRYSELFRQRTGYSPLHYFIRLKIQRACQYLCFTKMNIQQICGATGFDDPYYFSRIFKKQTGQSPAKYRKVNRY